MKSIAGVLLAAVLVAALALGPEAKDPKIAKPRFYKPDYVEADLYIPGYEASSNLLPTASAVDTYCIVWFDFEQLDWQGWTAVDNTAQKGTFFHVDDFAGLGGGTRGMLVPLDGTKSLWCGARPGPDPYVCSWAAAPGYGNYWDQSVVSDVMGHLGMVTLSYEYSVDTELGGDYISVIFAPGYQETEVARYYGRDSGTATHHLFSASASFYLKFQFVSDGSDSDEDGLRDYDGAFIIDNITVSDESGLLDFEDFETAAVGATETGIWRAYPGDGYGLNSCLANNLVDEDPCNDNFASQIVFFCYDSPIGPPEPGLFVTPFCTGSGGIEAPCQDEMVCSYWIDLNYYSSNCEHYQDTQIPPGELDGLGGLKLVYSVYLDNPVENLVFHTWHVRSMNDGCPGPWLSDPLVRYYGDDGLYYWLEHDISSYVTSDTIQVAVGVVDMCSVWYGIYGDCAEHTSAPWFDNVRLYRYETSGPQWNIARAELFQDTFPQEVTGSPDPMKEFCRADMACDVAPADELYRIDPGDSAVVRCSAATSGGLDTLATGEARVYCHVGVTFLGPDGKPDLFGPSLAGDYGSYVGDDGNWTVLLCEPARSSGGQVAPDAWCVDLNDSLFTRGYMIEYYFEAFALDGTSSTWPGEGRLLEFTCLPTLRMVPNILYVDDFDGRGTFDGLAQNYYDDAFKHVLPVSGPEPDRYDVNGPSSGLSNGIGAYTSVTHASSIFSVAYETVIFDSGDLERCTISDGTESSDKSGDARLLADWLNVAEHNVRLLVMGDGTASDLSGSAAPQALELMTTICGVLLLNGSYADMTGGPGAGGVVNPLISGIGGWFEDLEYYILGGCPVIDQFDVLEASGYGLYALRYPDYGGTQYYAGIYTDQLNNASQYLRTVWVGHSIIHICNAEDGIPARRQFLRETLEFFYNAGIEITHSETPAVTTLAGIYPNPFNPVTRVSFSLKKKGPVSLRVYDVSGRLVRVLVDEIREAGSYEVVWDGANDRGRATASGIYFCRMEADDYQRTVKMVQLR